MRAAIVEEVPVTISVNGTSVLQGTCTPGLLEAYAIGRLLAEGYVVERDAVHTISVTGAEHVRTIAVALPLPAAQAGEAERRHRAQHGCGILYYLDCAPESIRRPWAAEAPALSVFAELFTQLFASAGDLQETGGLHSAALYGGAGIAYPVHDVGRHNAVDKTIGLAMMAGENLTQYGLLLTSRISGEIALKAARARLGWVASRSIPTSLALRIARVANMPLIGRAPGKDAYVHEPTPPSVA
ncbi:MAG: formate dehydrogenase accessory sulfurtransferase FdhD [Longimicrobiales bacterium]